MITSEIRTKIQKIVLDLKQNKLTEPQCFELLKQFESTTVSREELQQEFISIKSATSDPPPPPKKK